MSAALTAVVAAALKVATVTQPSCPSVEQSAGRCGEAPLTPATLLPATIFVASPLFCAAGKSDVVKQPTAPSSWHVSGTVTLTVAVAVAVAAQLSVPSCKVPV